MYGVDVVKRDQTFAIGSFVVRKIRRKEIMP